MFRRKQNQIVQLIGIHPLGAELDPCSQQSDDTNVTTVLGGMPGGLKFHDAKMNPARRSWSLEDNLDKFDVDHVTIRGEDKGKSSHSSHPHGLNVDNQQRNRGVASISASPMGRRLQIIATPPSSSSLLSPTSSSPTVDDVIKTNVEIQVPHQPKHHQLSDAVKPAPFSNLKPQQQSGVDVTHSSDVMVKDLTLRGEYVFGMKLEETKMPLSTIPAGSGEKATSSEQIHGQPVSQFPPKTNYPDPNTAETDDNVFRERTDTANSAMFDISYDL